jgi:autotransporter-associated beta strand protein
MKSILNHRAVFCAIAMGISFSASAEILVGWDIPTSAAPNSSSTPTSVVASTNANGVASGATISLGSGIAVGNVSYGWGGTSWGSATNTSIAQQSLEWANSNNKCFNFAITAQPGKVLTINGVGSLSVMASGAGPGNWALLYSTNPTFSTYTTTATWASGVGRAASTGLGYTNSLVAPFTTALAASNVVVGSGRTAYFRIVGYEGWYSTGGTGRIMGNLAAPDFTILGTVADAPIQTFTWNGGSSGLWNYTASNWLDGSGASSAFSADNNASFTSGATLAITNTGVTAGFLSNNVPSGQTTTLTGGRLTSSMIVNSGAGNLVLGCPGTYTTINLNAGSITASANDSLSGAVNVSGGSILDVGIFSNTIGTLSVNESSVSGTGILTVAGSSFALDQNDQIVPISIAGYGGLVKTGSKILTLSGSNSFIGNIGLSGGTLATSGDERLPDTAVVVFSSGTTLKLGGNETINSLSAASAAASSSVDLQSYNLTLTATSSNQFQGTLIGSGSLTKQGTGILSINEGNTFTGGTVLKNGSMRMQDSGVRSTNTDTGIVTLFSGPFGTGPLSLQGGKIYSSSTNSRSIFNPIDIAGDFTLGDTAATSNGEMNVSTNVTGATTTVSASSTITVLSPTDWYQSISSGPGKILSKNGASYLRLRGANQIDTLQVLGGGLYVQNSNNLSSVIVGNTGTLGWGYSNIVGPCNYFGNATLVLSNGATLGQYGSCGPTNDVVDRTLANNLRIQGDVTFGLGTFSSYLAGGVDLTGLSRTLTLSNSTYFNGPLSNGSLQLASSSATRFLVLAASNNFNGPLALNGGMLVLSNPNALQGVTQIVFNGNSTSGGTLGLTPANTNDYSSLFSSGDLQNYRIDTGGANATLGTPLGSINGTFYKSGLGTLTLPVANLFQGGATLAEGRLALANNGSLGTGEFLIDQSGVEIETLTPLVLPNDVRLSGSPAIVGSHPLEITGTTRVSGGNRALYPSNQGGLILNRVELSTSPTNNAYRLVIYGTSPVVVNGSIVDGTNSTYTNGISGCHFRMSNPSTVTFRGTNTYTGPTWIEAGTLRIETTRSLPANGNLQLNGGILRLIPPGTYQVGNLSGSVETNTTVVTNELVTTSTYTYTNPDNSTTDYLLTATNTNVVTNILVMTNPMRGTVDMGTQGAVLRVASMSNWITNSVLTFTNYQVSGSVAYLPTNLTTEQIASIKNAANPAATASVDSQGLLSFSGSGNTAPSITVGQIFSVPENSTSGALVGAVVASDSEGDSLSGWTIVSGDPNGAFFINSSGEIRVAGIVNFEVNPSYALGVQVSDGTESSPIQIVTVNVGNMPEFTDVFGASALGSDDNGDGVSNLMAYAMGATSPSSSPIKPVATTTSSTLSITALVRINDPKCQMVGEATTSLTAWPANSPITGVAAADQSGAVAGVTQKQVFSVDRGTDPKKFMHLKAIYTP